jgi:mRNA interferase YafQ
MTTKTIDWSNAFKRDYKREYRTLGRDLDVVLSDFLVLLIMDTSIPDKYQNHKLSGEWAGLLECHLKPNLLLVYGTINQDEDNDLLWLVRLGSHSELFGK